MSDEQQLSMHQAYRAMLAFLERAYELTHSDGLAGLPGGSTAMRLASSSGTGDQVRWTVEAVWRNELALPNGQELFSRFLRATEPLSLRSRSTNNLTYSERTRLAALITCRGQCEPYGDSHSAGKGNTLVVVP